MIFELLKMFFSLVIPVIIGLPFISLVFYRRKDIHALERFALAFGCGFGAITLEMFFWSIFRIPLNIWTISLPWVIPIVGIYIWNQKRKNPTINRGSLRNFLASFKGPLHILEIILITAILAKIFYVFFETTIKPIIDVDSYARWSLVAKAIFIDKTFLTPFTLNIIENNPLLPVFAQAWGLICQGYWNDALSKAIFPAYYTALLIIFYYAMRKAFPRLNSLFFTWCLSTFPFWIYHSSTAYADSLQTFYYSIGTIYLYLFIKERNKQNLLCAAIFMAFGIWVKRGGIFLAGINILILLIFLALEHKTVLKEKINYLARFLAPIIILAGPWLIFVRFFLGRSVSNVAAEFGTPEAAIQFGNKFTTALSLFQQKMFFSANWHILWFIFLMVAIFSFRKIISTKLIYLFLLILINVGGLYCFFVFTQAYRWLLDGTLLNRMVMYQMPVVLFFVGNALNLHGQINKKN